MCKVQDIFMFGSQVYIHYSDIITLCLLTCCLSKYSGKTRKNFKHKICHLCLKNIHNLLFSLFLSLFSIMCPIHLASSRSQPSACG